MKKCTVHDPGSHDGNPLKMLGGTANFFQPVDITELAKNLLRQGKRVVVTPVHIYAGRDGEPHRHRGLTVEFPLSGKGHLKTPGENLELGPFDVVVIPPGAAHVAVSDNGNPLVLAAIYVGAEGDRQGFLE